LHNIPYDQFDRIETGQLLSRHSDNCLKLRVMVSCLSEAIMDFVPDDESGWSIREHIAHLVDTQTRTFVAYRNLFADGNAEVDLRYDEPNSIVRPIECDLKDLTGSVEVVEVLARIMVNHMSQMTDQQLEGSHTNRSEHSITLKGLLSINTLHLEEHLAHIQRNLNLCAELTDYSVWLP
jgi:hypothetical protein